jgi:hypothetical protein
MCHGKTLDQRHIFQIRKPAGENIDLQVYPYGVEYVKT